jgi:hypothetical protein
LSATPTPTPGSELKAILWIVVTLLAVLEVAWWFSERLYSS